MSELARRKLWFERNELAEQLEAEGKVDEALALYEENAAENCDVAYTYERMAALLRSKGRHDEELRALEKALSIEEKRGPTGQMLRLQKRIEVTKDMRERKGRSPVTVRTTATGSVRTGPLKVKQKKGCMTVLVLLLGSASLLLSLLA